MDGGIAVYDGDDLEALFEMPRYQRWIVGSFVDHLTGDAVEIGAGLGAVSQHLLPHVETIDLVEPSPQLADRLSARFRGNCRVQVQRQTLEHYLADRPSCTLDSVVMVNVLEHIDDDTAALAAICRVLRPGGRVMLFVPALPTLFSAMDAALGHHRRYTEADLGGLASRLGFRIIELRYFDLLGVLPWWLVNTIGGSTRFDRRLTRLYDRIGVPLTRGLESALRPPIGKNLMMIAERPGS